MEGILIKFIENIKKVYKKSLFGTSRVYIWDEVEYVKLIIKKNELISNHMFKDIYLLAKYYRHVEKMDDENITKKLKVWAKIDQKGSNGFERFLRMIEGAVRSSRLQKMKVLHEIRITLKEIDSINNMPDTTTRKIAFVLLCMWKANGNKPFRTNVHQVAREINLNANGKKLFDTFYKSLNWDGKYIYTYNQKTERRKRLLEKLIELDSQYGQLFIPYDSYKYSEHLLRPSRKSSIAIWRYVQEWDEEPLLYLPSYFENMTAEEKEEYKKYRYELEMMTGNDDIDLPFLNLDYIKRNIDMISRLYNRDDFAGIIGGDVFYSENEAHDKVKVLFADIECSNGILIDVNDLLGEYDKLFGENKVVYGKCTECDCVIIKNSNKTKYCNDCKNKVRKEKVKVNMRNMRGKAKSM